jgi:ADP-ribose pyrophosphatase YjhB (NUDIX family)
MNIGESIGQAVIREVREETNLDVEPTTIVGIYSDPGHVIAYADGEVARSSRSASLLTSWAANSPSATRSQLRCGSSSRVKSASCPWGNRHDSAYSTFSNSATHHTSHDSAPI